MLLSNPSKLDRSLTPLDLLRFTNGLYKGHSRFLISFLSIYLAFLPPKTSLPHRQPLPQGFFKFIQVFLHLVSFKSLIFMHFMLCNLSFWDFCKIWDFQNQRGFYEIFGMSFEDLILKTSCIASHEHCNSIVMHSDVCN